MRFQWNFQARGSTFPGYILGTDACQFGRKYENDFLFPIVGWLENEWWIFQASD